MAKFQVVFKEDRCKGCELCVSVCPKKILSIEEMKVNVKGYRPAKMTDITQCIGCANCALVCPDGIISIYAE